MEHNVAPVLRKREEQQTCTGVGSSGWQLQAPIAPMDSMCMLGLALPSGALAPHGGGCGTCKASEMRSIHKNDKINDKWPLKKISIHDKIIVRHGLVGNSLVDKQPCVLAPLSGRRPPIVKGPDGVGAFVRSPTPPVMCALRATGAGTGRHCSGRSSNFFGV